MTSFIKFVLFCTSILCSLHVSRPKVLVFGDSQAIATYGELRHVMGQNYEFDLLAKVGSRISYWTSDKLQPLATPRDTVIIFLGSNGYDTSPEDPKLILDSVGSARCIWVGPPRIRNRDYRFTKKLAEAVSQKCTYFDSQKLPLRLPDGIHPDSSSARFWAEKIVNVAKK